MFDSAPGVDRRGSPAIYSNPANLAETISAEVYGEFDIIVADYTFTYPGRDPVSVKIRTPAPFVGFAPAGDVAAGISGDSDYFLNGIWPR